MDSRLYTASIGRVQEPPAFAVFARLLPPSRLEGPHGLSAVEIVLRSGEIDARRPKFFVVGYGKSNALTKLVSRRGNRARKEERGGGHGEKVRGTEERRRCSGARATVHAAGGSGDGEVTLAVRNPV